ncbi:MAG TPA: TIGR03936 family radical SAM-associated protein [bacterium]|nr:TIGR03936 family radical SAM-associated protein [bacterium]
MIKIRIFYKKKNWLRYIGDRDLSNFIQRALRRADFSLVYTSGYTPRIKIGFSPAVPFGIESECEYFDFYLEEWSDLGIMRAKLSQQFYPELELTEIVYHSETRSPHPRGCVYRVENGSGTEEIEHLFGKELVFPEGALRIVRIRYLV